MKPGRLLLTAAGFVLLAARAGFAGPGHPHRVEANSSVMADGKAIEVMAEEALVRFDQTTDPAVRLAALQQAGMQLVGPVGNGPVQLVYLPSGMRVADGLARLRALAGVLDAQPNRAYRLLKTPNDPMASSQYHFSNINAFPAWEYTTGGSNVTIAVLDTGIQGNHPDLQSKIISGGSVDCSAGSCTTSGETPLPHAACEHATRVAGVAAAVSNNGVGVAGVSWGARLVSVKIFPDSGCNADCSDTGGPPPTCVASDAAIEAALAYATTAYAAPVVVNMSIGATGGCASVDSGNLQTQINSAYAAGVTIVAAAGNSGGEVENPGNCNHVIPVGATDSSNNIASFSSRDVAANALASNGLVAPGVGLTTTDVGSAYTSDASGTSFSSPLVAGIASLILTVKPAATPAEVQSILRNSATNIGLAPGVQGAGLANAFLAVRLAQTGTAQFDGSDKVIAFPNPFRLSQTSQVSISIPNAVQGANATIKIYTTSGQLVRTLTGLTWDGRNETGTFVASGTYILLVSSDHGSKRGRVAVIR